jgi:hypothetical protein
VNLGKRQTKSADLKVVFESLGFEGVKTVIASGNVLFESGAERGLKSKIEKALAKLRAPHASHRRDHDRRCARFGSRGHGRDGRRAHVHAARAGWSLSDRFVLPAQDAP